MLNIENNRVENKIVLNDKLDKEYLANYNLKQRIFALKTQDVNRV